MQTLKLIISLLLAILVVSIILANPWMVDQRFPIHYLGYESPPIHLVIYLLLSLTMGSILTALTMLAGQLRLKNMLRNKNKKIRQMEEELNSLRNLPLKESGQGRAAEIEPEASTVLQAKP